MFLSFFFCIFVLVSRKASGDMRRFKTHQIQADETVAPGASLLHAHKGAQGIREVSRKKGLSPSLELEVVVEHSSLQDEAGPRRALGEGLLC